MGHSEGARFLWIRIVIPLTLDTYPHVLPGLGDAAAGAMDEASGWFGCSTLGSRYPWHLTSFTLRLSRSTCEYKKKRRGWDSNPRDGSTPPTRFPVALLRPTRTPLRRCCPVSLPDRPHGATGLKAS